MRQRHILTGLASAILVVVATAGPTRAETIGVTTDSGEIGSFTLTNRGGGLFALSFPNYPVGQTLLSINGSPVSTPADFGSNINLTVTAGLGTHNYTIDDSVVYTKIFSSTPSGSPNPFSLLNYTIASGQAGDSTDPTHLFLKGLVGSVPNPLVDVGGTTYDFTGMTGSVIDIILNGSLSGSGFDSMFAFMGTSTTDQFVMGTASFVQTTAVVPEPSSLAIMGVSMSVVGLLAYRRAKRAATA